MLDDGRLTDGQGRTVDFKNTVIIMTSNIPMARRRGDASCATRAARLLESSSRSSSTASTTSSLQAAEARAALEIVQLQVALVLERVAERGVPVTLTDDATECSATSATTRSTAPGR